MELMAVIEGLSALKRPVKLRSSVTALCIERFVKMDGILEKEWLASSRRAGVERGKNVDLWQRLDELGQIHSLNLPRSRVMPVILKTKPAIAWQWKSHTDSFD